MDRPQQALEYPLGHAPTEIRRLILQSAILRPITERLLRSAGIGAGMKVLDLGCGPGDVAMLAAQIVGADGWVLGIDQSPEALATAAERAGQSGLTQISFIQSSVDEAIDRTLPSTRFDAVIGRYILCYLTDPASTLRRAAASLRPEGILAFHEVDILGQFGSQPPVPLWDQVGRRLFDGLRPAVGHPEIASRLVECFESAGLSTPNLFCECPVGGGEASPLYGWLAETMRSVIPLLAQSSVESTKEIDIDTLESRLRQATTLVRGQITVPAQVCAWSRLI